MLAIAKAELWLGIVGIVKGDFQFWSVYQGG